MIKWDVEIGSFSLELLLESLSKELKWGPNQVPTVWFVDKRCGEDVRLVDERQMTDLFEMYKSEMSCRVIVSIFDKDVVAEHEYDTLGPLCVVPPDDVCLDMHDIHTQYASVNHNEPRVTQGGGVSASKEAILKGLQIWTQMLLSLIVSLTYLTMRKSKSVWMMNTYIG